ncbi:hypothetical protein VSR01_27555 [Actinacidiphila sp. DG2A-62]|uniref:hypothetical protein n=1 Tax=Actinacidiphila sp. DG2A-62 TaxID=3108821 RepID=UPI002DB6EB5A|nr:hypothetical protein [Actinacidiphila sp. DG2A-62]MEC3997058.1 hypothetical protein [Actinacidiphila sp. DG2A-62]
MAPMPARQILPLDGERHYMPLVPDDSESLILSIHQNVVHALVLDHDEFGLLVEIAMRQESRLRGHPLPLANPIVGFFLASLRSLTLQETWETADRLVARGFAVMPEEHGYAVDETAIRIVERSALSASFLMSWNAAKVGWDRATTS